MATAFDLSQFYDQEAYSDVTIRFGDHAIKCHKLVLAKGSKVLARMLDCSSGFKEATEKEVWLLEDEPEALEAMLKHLYGFKYQNLSSGFAMRHPLQVLQVADKYDVPNLAAEVHPLCDVGTIGRSVDIIHCIGIIDLIHEALPLRGGLVHAANQLAARNFIRLSRRLDFKVVAAKHPSLAWYLIENAARKMCGSDGMTMDAAVCLLCADCGVELILRDSDLVAVCPACQQYISDENWHEATTCLVEPDP